MKFIVTLLAFLIITPVFATLAHAAPTVGLSTDAQRRFVLMSFSGLREVTKVSYTLTYTSNGRTRGFEGLLRPKARTNRTTKKQILGTCSSGKCVYHPSPKNITIDATFTLRSGKTVNATKTLP